jgi:hypothetical protein
MNWIAAMCGICLIAGAAVTGCGNSGNGASDASFDAPIDAPFGPVGLWRLRSETTTFDDGGTRTVNDTDPTRVNGTVEITTGEYAIGVKHVLDGGLATTDETTPNPQALVTEHSAFGPADSSIALSNGLGTVPFVWQKSPSEMLTLQTDATHSLAFSPYVWTATTTAQVRGTVTVETGGSSPAPDHVAIVWIVRSLLGAAYDYQSNTPESRVLTLDSNHKGTFNLDRSTGTPGYSRILFGTAEVSIGLIVAYADSDASGAFNVTNNLDDRCSMLPEDCLRGISTVVLAYRFGDSPELAASPFAHLRQGWSFAKEAYDHRNGNNRLGLVSLDSTTGLPFDISVPQDVATYSVPHFYLTSP